MEELELWQIAGGSVNGITARKDLADSFLFLRFYLFIFRQRGKVGERGKHQCVVASHMPPTGDLARNPGMCPDWELNRWPFVSQAGAQSTEPHMSQGTILIKLNILLSYVPALLLLCCFLSKRNEMHIYTRLIHECSEALFVTAKNWKQYNVYQYVNG